MDSDSVEFAVAHSGSSSGSGILVVVGESCFGIDSALAVAAEAEHFGIVLLVEGSWAVVEAYLGSPNLDFD